MIGYSRFGILMRNKTTKIVNKIKADYRIPLWVAYLVWFVETSLFYDWVWARNRIVMLISEKFE